MYIFFWHLVYAHTFKIASFHYYYRGLLSFDTLDIWNQIIRCSGDCPVHGGVVSSILGFYPVAPLSCDTQKCLQTLPRVLSGAKPCLLSQMRTAVLHKESVIIIINSKIGKLEVERGKNTRTRSQVNAVCSMHTFSTTSWSWIRICQCPGWLLSKELFQSHNDTIVINHNSVKRCITLTPNHPLLQRTLPKFHLD